MKRKPMNPILRRIEAMRRFVPKPGKGYNVVGVDDYESPGHELFLVGNFPSKAEAEKAKKARERGAPGHKFYVYPPASDGRYDPAKGL
jgi:hypothetical protein